MPLVKDNYFFEPKREIQSSILSITKYHRGRNGENLWDWVTRSDILRPEMYPFCDQGHNWPNIRGISKGLRIVNWHNDCFDLPWYENSFKFGSKYGWSNWIFI